MRLWRIEPVTAVQCLAMLYAGALIGVSFIATPAKFISDGVPLPQLLLVGRATFGVFAVIEFILAGALLLLAYKDGRALLLAIAVLAFICAQHFLIRPVLDTRLLDIVAGQEVPGSHWHHLYGALDLIKLIALLAAARISAAVAASPAPL